MKRIPRYFVFGLGFGLAAAALLVSSPDEARATMKMQTDARKAGFEIKSCLDCHNERLPKKDNVTENHRGQWLVDQKKERGAEEIDVAWLKDYKEPEEK